MNLNRTILKSFCLSLFIYLTVISNAQATYIFEWQDFGGEWWFSSSGSIVMAEANIWEGYFTLPDSAVTNGINDGDYQYISLDLTQYSDFSLTGELISGNYMEATEFHGDSVVTTIQSNNSKDIELDNYMGPTGSDISFVMVDPSWIDTPLYLTIIDDDHWFYYNDMVLDSDTQSMVSASISHDGIFVGHYVDDATPVPEPATMLLLGTGLVGLVCTRLKRKKRCVLPPTHYR